jgi:thiamine biosynthesis lipoprotein
LQVDLSAIAKGHGVDRVAEVLDKLNVSSYFVEIGGEVRTKGHKPGGEEWQVGIERPTPEQRSVERILPLSGRALATSGNYRNYHVLEGRSYSHTINPKTGYPVEDPIASASVVADNCALADGIATGMMSAGFDAGMALAEKHGWCVFLIKPKSGQSNVEVGFETLESTGFKAEFAP